MLDFCKAFDKVLHNRLAHKLDHYGVCGNALNWISAVFTNSSQCVVLEGEAADTVKVASGVFQGSVLNGTMQLSFYFVLMTHQMEFGAPF